jgi:hypothetical protein
MLRKAFVVFATLSLVACGGSSTSSDRDGSGGETQVGRFVDSTVSGLDYSSEGMEPSLTDSNGTFRYRENTPITFSIGGLVLGKAVGNAILTPMDLVPGAREAQARGTSYDEIYANFPAVLNIARFLQTLDVDLDASNGRSIPLDAKALVSSYIGEIDFSSNEFFAGDTSPAVEYICEVKRKRGQEGCSASIIVSEKSASAELTKTEETKASGARVNSLPSVVGGDDQSVMEGQYVVLSGTASDSDGSIVRVEWFESDVSGIRKAGGIAIQGKDTLEVTFTAPSVSSDQLIYLALNVEDNDGGRGTDVVNVLVKQDNETTDLSPKADAGSDQTVFPKDTVVLDGAGSYDAEGAIASYSWAQVDENGNVVTDGPEIQNPNEAQMSFVAPDVIENTAFLFRLTVTDSQTQSDSDLANVIVEVSSENTAPVADAGADQFVESDATVELDGSGSSDEDGDILTYAWTQIEGPLVDLSDSNSATPQFEAPSVEGITTLSFSLTVSDAQLSTTDVTNVTVLPSPSAQPEGGYSGSYKNSNPEFDESANSVLQWNKDGAGMSYDVVIEPRHDFSEPVVRYQWRALGCPVNSGMPSRVQPRAFIAREPAPEAYCSDNACRQQRGTYQSTLPDGSTSSGWNQFEWGNATADGEPSVGRAHLVAMIVDDLKDSTDLKELNDLADCNVVQMRCIEVADRGAASSDFHEAFWNEIQCSRSRPEL